MDTKYEVEIIDNEIKEVEKGIYTNKLKERFLQRELIDGHGAKDQLEGQIGRFQQAVKGDERYVKFLREERESVINFDGLKAKEEKTKKGK